jgi:hypothetical protein
MTPVPAPRLGLALLVVALTAAPGLADAPTLQERRQWMLRLVELQRERLDQRRRCIQAAGTARDLEACGGGDGGCWHQGPAMGGPGMGGWGHPMGR